VYLFGVLCINKERQKRINRVGLEPLWVSLLCKEHQKVSGGKDLKLKKPVVKPFLENGQKRKHSEIFEKVGLRASFREIKSRLPRRRL